VVCAHDGTWRLTTCRRPEGPAGWSDFWGELIGAVTDDRRRLGLDPAFRAGLEAGLRPGASALLVVVPTVAEGKLLDALSPFEGEVLLDRTPAELLHWRPPTDGMR
jgi:hypothetical protein